MVTVKTKSIYDPVEPEDGVRILVMRIHPRGFSNKRLSCEFKFKDLAPSKRLLLQYRVGMVSWEYFVILYRNEMENSETAKMIIRGIAEGGYGETVTLLCWERGTEHCHRFILKQLIEEAAKK